jgi:hypothetical protein
MAQSPQQLHVISEQGSGKLPLVQALRVIGLHIKGGFVSFGVDISGETEPEVDINMPDTELADALNRVISQIPGYASTFVSQHVVEIYPIKGHGDPNDPLNLPIREFSVHNLPAMTILSSPPTYIPELNDYLARGQQKPEGNTDVGCGHFTSILTSDVLGVNLIVGGKTVRQVLDAIAEADASLPGSPAAPSFRSYPVGWVHKTHVDPKLGIVHTWSAVSFAPHDWRLYAPK